MTVRRLENLRRQVGYRLIVGSECEVTPALPNELLAEPNEIMADARRAWLRLRAAQLHAAAVAGDETAV